MRWKRRAEEPTAASGRGAHLIKTNFLRGTGAKVRTGGMGVYVTDRSKDKPNTLQGTRR